MKHNIRINGEIKTVDCEFGSGILDKNGKEFFENDIAKDYKGEIFNVVFDGSFNLENYGKSISLDMYNKCVEVVGHVDD